MTIIPELTSNKQKSPYIWQSCWIIIWFWWMAMSDLSDDLMGSPLSQLSVPCNPHCRCWGSFLGSPFKDVSGGAFPSIAPSHDSAGSSLTGSLLQVERCLKLLHLINKQHAPTDIHHCCSWILFLITTEMLSATFGGENWSPTKWLFLPVHMVQKSIPQSLQDY